MKKHIYKIVTIIFTFAISIAVIVTVEKQTHVTIPRLRLAQPDNTATNYASNKVDSAAISSIAVKQTEATISSTEAMESDIEVIPAEGLKSWQNMVMINNPLYDVLGNPVNRTTANSDISQKTWRNNISGIEHRISSKKEVQFETKMMLPNPKTKLVQNGVAYRFASPQGSVVDSQGNTYILYSPYYAHSSNFPIGGTKKQKFERVFILKVMSGVTNLSKQENVDNAYKNGDVEMSSYFDYGYHGMLLSIINNQLYLMGASHNSHISRGKLYAGIGLYKVQSDTLKISGIATGAYSTSTIVSATNSYGNITPANFVMVNGHTGYFVMNGTSIKGHGQAMQQLDGYSFYQVKINNSKLVISRLAPVLMNRLGQSGQNGENDRRNSIQAVSYHQGRLFISADDAWMSFSLNELINLNNQIVHANYKTGYDEKKRLKDRNKIKWSKSNIKMFDFQVTEINSNQEQENISFDENGTMNILMLGQHQILIQK